MALTQYCELEEVRAALGVNDLELSDAVLNLPVYEIGLVRELAKVSGSLPAAFSSIQSSPEADWSDAQRTAYEAVRLFSVYACAKQVGVSLGSITPKGVSDGKASVARFADSPYKDVLARVEQMYASTRANLLEAYTALTGSGTSQTMRMPVAFAASSRNYDPVTGS